jgi:hypothetical protein
MGSEELVQPGSILLVNYAEIDVFLQLQSAPDGCIGFKELVRPGSILTSKYSDVNVLL